MDWWWKAALPLVTFILGFFASRFTLTKSERLNLENAKQDRSEALVKQRDEAFSTFAAALTKYANLAATPTLDDFTSVAISGEKYFTIVQITCDAILQDMLPQSAVENSHLSGVKDVVERSLPKFFGVLKQIADAQQLKYNGTLRRSDYKSIYAVYERFALGG